MSSLESRERVIRRSEYEINPKAFKFEIGDFVYEDRVGESGVETVEADPLEVEGTGHVVQTSNIYVTDPYVNGNPEAYKLVNEYIQGIEKEINKAGWDVLAERQNPHAYNGFDPREGTPFTTHWVKSDKVEALRNWRNMIPSAAALGYLTLREILGSYIPNDEGREALVTPETAMQLRCVDDAVAIRDRAAALQELALRHLVQREIVGRSVSWLSLACGTAEPSILAAKEYMNRIQGSSVDMHALDDDPVALSMVANVASREGYTGSFKTHKGNLLDDNYPSFVRDVSGLTEFDVVENMGFEEYLPSDGDSVGAFKDIGIRLPQASDFTRNAWDLVAPGGLLISGNMVLDRPQIGFVFGVVGWPIINARTEQEILSVYKRAGILDDPRAKLTMHRVRNKDTGVCIYNIVTVEKSTKV